MDNHEGQLTNGIPSSKKIDGINPNKAASSKYKIYSATAILFTRTAIDIAIKLALQIIGMA